MVYQKLLRPKFIVFLRPDLQAPEVPASLRKTVAHLQSTKLEDAILEAEELGLHGEVCRVEATL